MKKFNLMQVVPSLQSGGVEQGTIDVANYLSEIEIKANPRARSAKLRIAKRN